MSDNNIEELVEAYINVRSERDRIQKEYEAADADLKADLDQLKVLMLDICQTVGADSIKTSYGTVMRKLSERFFCSDWDSFRTFEQEHPDYDLRERRIHQGNFKQFLSEHEGDGLPPGVSALREYDVSVRKSTSAK